MDGWVGGWVGGWVDGWMDGWMDGWTDGWTDGQGFISQSDGLFSSVPRKATPSPHIAECSNLNSNYCLQTTIAGYSINTINIVLCPFSLH